MFQVRIHGCEEQGGSTDDAVRYLGAGKHIECGYDDCKGCTSCPTECFFVTVLMFKEEV